MELDEYIWSIHSYIDWVTHNTQLRNDIMNASSVPNKYLTGIKTKQYIKPGIVYAPYIPMIVTAIKAKQRKLKSAWKVELAEDLQIEYGMDGMKDKLKKHFKNYLEKIK